MHDKAADRPALRRWDEGGRTVPAVSVVIAAYNRSHLLRAAVQSVLEQSFDDFEVLVIGDACTDDSEHVVSQFNDQRVKFYNLPINFGDQSGPNNVGVAHARGRYIAFLNQDDLWLPDHLDVCVAWIEATGAHIVHALAARISARPVLTDPASWEAGMSCGGPHFDPARDFAACSTWLMRADAFDRIGMFRPALECVIESSQDLLFRAWRAGLTHRRVPNLSVVIIPSGERANSYRERDRTEHDAVLDVLTRGDGRMQLLSRLPSVAVSRWQNLRQAVVVAVLRPLGWLGISPRLIRIGLARQRRRGSLIQGLRAIRGLDPIWHSHDVLTAMKLRELARLPTYSVGSRVTFGIEGDGGRYRERGWCGPQTGGTWTGDRTATFMFAFEDDTTQADLRFELQATPFTGPGRTQQRLLLRVDETVLFEGSLENGSDLSPIIIPASARHSRHLLRITLDLPDACSPRSLGVSDDVRLLGLFVMSASLSVNNGAV